MLELAPVAGLAASAVALAGELGLAWLVLQGGGAGLAADGHWQLALVKNIHSARIKSIYAARCG